MAKQQKIDKKIRKVVLGYVEDAKNSQKLSEHKDRAREYQDFYRGHQWSELEYNHYKSKGIEPITLNRCRPTIKSIVGMYLSNRNSIRVMPVKDGTKAAAGVLTEIVKHTEDKSNADYKYRTSFSNGVKDSESYLYLDVDKKKGINGQVLIKEANLFNVDVDPSCETYDINDPEEGARYAVIKKWVDKQRIERLFKELAKPTNLSGGDLPYEDALNAYMAEACTDEDEESSHVDHEYRNQYRYCTKTVWWKEPIDGIIVTDKETGTSKTMSEDHEAYKTFKGKKFKRFKVDECIGFRLHKSLVIGSNVLADEANPFTASITDLPVFRYSPYWDEGYASGQLDDIISLNREENIHRTQTIKLLNQTANSGWITKKAIDEKARNDLTEYGSVDGLVIETDLYGGTVEKIQPNNIPPGMFALGEKFGQDVKQISGIDDATMGLDNEKAESGRAISLKQQQNKVTAESAFDNFYYTVELLGQYLVDMIRRLDVYTDDEIIGIISESTLMDDKLIMKTKSKIETQIGASLPQPQMLQPLPPEVIQGLRTEDKMKALKTVRKGVEASMMYANAYPKIKENYDDMVKYIAAQELVKQLRGDQLGSYGVKVTVSPSAPTEKMLRFMEIDSIASKYPGLIPPDVIVDASNIANKDEIKNRILQAQQAAMQPQTPQAQPQQQQKAG